MAKIPIALLFFISSLVAVGVGTGGTLPIEGNREMYFYSSSSNAKIIFLSCDDEDKFVYFRPALKGESVTVAKEEDLNEFLKTYKVKKILSLSVANTKSDYYYSDKIRGYKFVNGKKVNLQVAKGEYGYKVGSPIIFGSY